MTKWNDGITGVHLDIAASTASRIGVLAGPGTGKTTYGLMRRVVRLLEEGTPGDRILLLSFTRVAAADLRDKIESLNAPGSEFVRATTLHAYCFGLLQRDAVLATTGRHPRVLLSHEVDLMLRDIGGDYGTLPERKKRLEAMVAAWARDPGADPDAPPADDDRDFAHDVERWLRQHKGMLIGEVVPLAYRYLQSNPAADEHHAFDHIIVDEYQDLNSLEQKLLDLLAGTQALCVAGDDDQSIYSVRYANPQGILEYMARPDVRGFAITTCGRSPANILDMANALIQNAPGRTKPDLTALIPGGSGKSAIVQWQDAEEEVEGIVAAIASDVGSGRRSPGDILVLTNWRRMGERIRAQLEELEIPARSYFTQEELTADEGRSAMATLRLLADQRDQIALRVLLGLGDDTGRSAAYQRVLHRCFQEGIAPLELLGQMADGSRTDVVARAILGRYKDALARLGVLANLSLSDVVDSVLPPDQPLVSDLRSTALDSLASGSADIAALVSDLVAAVTQDEVPQNPDFVRVMSLHKSKGLTSPSVYVVGAMHGIIPTIKDEAPATVEAAMTEGRRLFYVAVTRASDELVISSSLMMVMADAFARQVKTGGKPIKRNGQLLVRCLTSPFVAELGSSSPRPLRGVEWLSKRNEAG